LFLLLGITAMSDKDQQQLERELDKIEEKLPDVATGWLAWLRRPSHRLVRIPVGIILVIGSVFSILPVLGLWMMPLGLMLLAIDVPFLQRPVTKMLQWIERTWSRLRNRWKGRRR
jgi:disulfide bond formation protein DsbB